jgi:hypothetical protein
MERPGRVTADTAGFCSAEAGTHRVMTQHATRIGAQYARDSEDERPLRSYVGILGAYTAAAAVTAGLARLTGRSLPDRVSFGDAALLAVATHKLSRLLAKDAVTSPLRAPFTRVEGPAGEAELNESPRGHGMQHSFGELMTCPFCLGVWISSGLSAGLVFAPRLTRLFMATASAVAASDFLHLAYDGGKKLVS